MRCRIAVLSDEYARRTRQKRGKEEGFKEKKLFSNHTRMALDRGVQCLDRHAIIYRSEACCQMQAGLRTASSRCIHQEYFLHSTGCGNRRKFLLFRVYEAEKRRLSVHLPGLCGQASTMSAFGGKCGVILALTSPPMITSHTRSRCSTLIYP